MTLEKFIETNNVDKTNNLISPQLLKEIERKINVHFGGELKAYVLKYGHLAFKFAELYGINSLQKENSDMVTQTLYLHKYFPLTEKFVALENQGEGDYYIVDKDDAVFEYDTNVGQIRPTGMKLFDYIAHRFESIRGRVAL